MISASVRSLPAQVVPMVIDIDRAKWEVPRNHLPSRHHSAEKQTAIRTQLQRLLELGVIEELQASIYRRRSMAIDLRLCPAQRCDKGPRRLVHSEHTRNTHATSVMSSQHETGRHETVRGWPLLSMQHAEQGPQRPYLRHM